MGVLVVFVPSPNKSEEEQLDPLEEESAEEWADGNPETTGLTMELKKAPKKWLLLASTGMRAKNGLSLAELTSFCNGESCSSFSTPSSVVECFVMHGTGRIDWHWSTNVVISSSSKSTPLGET